MAITQLTDDLSFVSKMDDYPPDDYSTTGALKAVFDAGSNAIKTYINGTLIPQLESGFISSFERTSGDGSAGTFDTYTITYHDDTTATFTIYNGADGEKGDKGETGDTGATGATGTSAYVHVKWGTSSTPAALIDTPNEYIGIAATSDATPPADYTGYSWYQWKGLKGDTGEQGIQGIQGEQGIQGIQGIQGLKGDKGDTGEQGIQGVQGVQGEQGNGIASVTRTSGTGAAGTTDTYTITFTDSTTTTFQVYNGADGEGSGDMLVSVYDPNSKAADAFNADNHVSGTTNKVFSATEQSKLTGIAEGANNYSHPATHSPSIITQDASNRFVTDTEKSTWNGKQAALTFDSSPTSGSSNPVTSGGVYTAVSAKATYVSGTGTIPVGTSWSGPDTEGYYYYALTATGVTATDEVDVTRTLDVSDADAAAAIQEAWNLVADCVPSANTLTFYALEQTAVAIPVTWKLVR